MFSKNQGRKKRQWQCRVVGVGWATFVKEGWGERQ